MVSSREIAAALGLDHVGLTVPLNRPASIGKAGPGALLFVTEAHENDDLLPPIGPVAVIAHQQLWTAAATLISDNPRRDFGRAVAQFFAPNDPPTIHPTAVIEHTTFGRAPRVGPHTCIGTLGFGLEGGERLPHLGGVRIGDDVEIGALCAIARGTLDDTVIGDRVRIDDHVFIAHNVQIGDDVTIIAGAEISGSVVIGAGAIISPQACICDHVRIGVGAHVGIGAVVLKDVSDHAVVVGNPARQIR